jgi:hypothetical protein
MSRRNGKGAPRATGASALCQASPILESRPGASQALASEGEPHAGSSTCSAGAGGSMTRRFLMNSIVALPIAAAVPVASPVLANSLPPQDGHGDEAAMLARAERAIETFRTRVISEDFTLDNDAAERVLRYFRRAAEGYPDDEDEWSAVIEFFGHHGGNVLGWILTGGVEGMICTTAALAVLERGNRKDADDDSRLLEIENEIFELKEKIEAFKPEMVRLQNIWSEEMLRLYRASATGECTLSKEERSAAVVAMPEAIEHARLAKLQKPLQERAYELERQMWSTPARTPEGRRAKVLVLLSTVMADGWRDDDGRADWDIRMARDLLIEFVGGEPAEQLRDQFRAEPESLLS